jgi:hypothetical protein
VLDPAPNARFEKADSIPVGTLQPIDENQAVKSSIKSEDELMVDGIKEQGTVPAEIIQPGHEQHSAVTRDPQAMANVGSEEEARIPIGAVQPAGGNQTLTPSTSSEGELTRDVGVEQGSIPAPIQGELGVAAPDSDEVANTGSEKKDRIPVGATVGGTNDQGTVPAEIIQRAHEERGAAILDGEGMATAGPEEGDRIPAGAVVPGDDDQLMKPFSSSYEP